MMPVTRAPRLQLTNPPGLHAAYTAWAEHHDTCEVCQVHDWYNPGFPREVAEKDAWDSDKTIEQNGRTRYYRGSPDPLVLCSDGSMLFRHWLRSAAQATTRSGD